MFLHSKQLWKKDGKPDHLGRIRGQTVLERACWIVRGSGHEAYCSKPCATWEEARELAYKFLKRNPRYIDTTTGHLAGAYRSPA
jgi:hypothetical protein